VEHLSKPQKEKNITKDKLVGMKVINSDGKLVGTVKEIGFIVGKPGISLSIESTNGETLDVSWENIQGAEDFVVLKPNTQEVIDPSAMQQVQPVTPVQAQPVQQATQNQASCPTCKGPLTYIPQYQRWYCYKCQKYA
jgi:sporulation protein YlmC with PRC-barrel domain